MDDDDFEIECMALEAIFPESFRRGEGRNLCVTVEPVTREGDALHEWVFSLILEAPENYPEELPVFKVNSLENTVYSALAKEKLSEALEGEASAMKGEQMVYNLVEWLKENLIEFVELSKEATRKAENEEEPSEKTHVTELSSRSQPKQEKMTKAQKRRFYSRFGAVDEKPRGWDWVDIIAHLSSRPQTQLQ